MAQITIDDKGFQKGIKNLIVSFDQKVNNAIRDVANEVLRLSSFEVPHDKGLLQSSGNVEPEGDHFLVGYNKVYAARLHEHPEYHFQKGRKGKYLEDPIKNNLVVFKKYIKEALYNL